MRLRMLGVLLTLLLLVVVTQLAEAAYSAPLYKQCDSRWANDRMGGGDTLCRSGCAVSSVAAALAGKGIKIGTATTTPKNLNAWMKTHGGYSGNLIIWGAIARLNSRISFQGRYSGGGSLSAATLRGYLNAGNKAIIANVRNGGHWVLLTNHNGGTTFNCRDSGYSNTSYNYSNFVGYAVYTIR